MITKELIEDAFIHLEDNFNIHYSINLFRVVDSGHDQWGDRFGMYDILKVEPRLIQSFGIYTRISLDYKNPNNKPFYKFEEWNKINSEISTAIKRIIKDPSVARISTDYESDYVIAIPTSKEFQVENIDRLVNLCKKFNNLFSPSLAIFPQFHYDKGIVIYLREVSTTGNQRFKGFNENLESSKYLSDNFKFVEKFDTEEQLLRSNQFLREKTSQLDKFIIYELEPLEFRVVK